MIEKVATDGCTEHPLRGTGNQGAAFGKANAAKAIPGQYEKKRNAYCNPPAGSPDMIWRDGRPKQINEKVRNSNGKKHKQNGDLFSAFPQKAI